jgi:N-acetyl-gamma-glutamyl-phosphate reductase
MAHRLGIVGASGYGGAELLRLLDGHPAIDVAVVAAHAQAGAEVASLFPNLVGPRTFDAVHIDELLELDVVVLATPHEVALDLGARLHDANVRAVDLSAGFRLSADGFAQWYGQAHPRPELTAAPCAAKPPAAGPGLAGRSAEPAGGAATRGPRAGARVAYGLPELGLREAVAAATLVANPGCYPTAALLALAPLAPLLEPGSLVVDAKSGTSGAGRAAQDHLHFAHVHGDLVAYGVPSHRHTGEIEQWLPGELGPITFTPHLVPMSRGLLATCYASLRDDVADGDALDRLVADHLHDAYATEPFVSVLPAGTFPHTKAVAGSNGCQLSAVADPRTRRIVVTAAIDNLGKGAAGQALQNVNLLLGLAETTGLSSIGVYP